jgi:hypothetical protein
VNKETSGTKQNTEINKNFINIKYNIWSPENNNKKGNSKLRDLVFYVRVHMLGYL